MDLLSCLVQLGGDVVGGLFCGLSDVVQRTSSRTIGRRCPTRGGAPVRRGSSQRRTLGRRLRRSRSDKGSVRLRRTARPPGAVLRTPCFCMSEELSWGQRREASGCYLGMVHLGAAPTCVRRSPIILCGEAFRSVRDEQSKAFAVIMCDDRRSSRACEVRRSQLST